jgi:probable HAF family extracellular repeat protein
MNKILFWCKKRVKATVLLLAIIPLANATTYRVQEITRSELADLTFSINGGNQFLNNLGQVTGTSRKYSKDKLYNFGDRAFLWDSRGLQNLGNFGADANNYAASSPNAIDDKGNVIGSSIYFIKDIDHGIRAFSWNKGKLSNLNAENDNFLTSQAIASNGNGWVLGSGQFYEQGIDKGIRLFLWKAGKIKSVGSIIGHYGAATDLNINNRVVGYHQNLDDQGNAVSNRAFLWGIGNLSDLTPICNVPLDSSSYNAAIAINDADTVLGSSDVCDPEGNILSGHAVLWKNGNLKDLGALGADPNGYSDSTPVAININDQVIGYSSIFDGEGNWQGQHGFLWLNGTMHDMGSLGVDESGYSFSTPYAINANGQVVGFSTYSENGVAKGNRAFLYQNSTMLDLNSTLPANIGLVLENALAINDKGQITAFGSRTKEKETYQVYVLLTPVQ